MTQHGPSDAFWEPLRPVSGAGAGGAGLAALLPADCHAQQMLWSVSFTMRLGAREAPC